MFAKVLGQGFPVHKGLKFDKSSCKVSTINVLRPGALLQICKTPGILFCEEIINSKFTDEFQKWNIQGENLYSTVSDTFSYILTSKD